MCLLRVLYFKYTPGVYLTTIQSNPIFQNLEKHIFSFYCLFVCGAFASHMCVCSSVKRSGPKSKVEYNNSLCLTKLYGKASNLHLFTAFSSNSRTRLHTGSHELTSKQKRAANEKFQIGGEVKKKETVNVPMFATIFFFFISNSNYILWDNKGICLLWGWIYQHVLLQPNLHSCTSLSV